MLYVASQPSEYTMLKNMIIPGFCGANTSYLTLVHTTVISMEL